MEVVTKTRNPVKNHDSTENKNALNFKTPQGDEITVTYEMITPEIAEEILLNKNTANRNIDKRLVSSLTKEMQKEHWLINGDTIRFDSEGVLRNGQHTLSAIVNSGIAQGCIVLRGLSPDTFSTMDSGRKRSASDILSIAGIEDYSRKAGLAKKILLFNNGYYRSTKGGGDRSATPGNFEILEFVREHENKLEEALLEASDLKTGFPYLNVTMSSFLFAVTAKHGKAKAKRFFYELRTGEEMSTPVKLFRKEMMSDKRRIAKLPYNTVLAYFIKAWNAFKAGEEIDKLSYDKEEGFPIPK